MPKLATMI